MEDHHKGRTKRIHERVNPVAMDPRATKMRKGQYGGTAAAFSAEANAEGRRIMRDRKRQANYDATWRNYHPLFYGALRA